MYFTIHRWISAATFAIVLAALSSVDSGHRASAGFVPPAFDAFCKKNPSECKRQGRAVRAIALTPEREKQMRAINREVNNRIRQVAEAGDTWSIPTKGRGDCEDLALLKRQKLIALGWPSSVLLMTVAKDRDGVGHAVLTVVTTKGDYILDNKTSKIRFAAATGYRYFSRQSAADPKTWVTIRRPGKGVRTSSLGKENVTTEEDERLLQAYQEWVAAAVEATSGAITAIATIAQIAGVRGAGEPTDRFIAVAEQQKAPVAAVTVPPG